MKTDNNIVSNESLEDAANNHADNEYGKNNTDTWTFEETYLWQKAKSSFLDGANWKKEQYAHLLESHDELLENIIRIIDRIEENEYTDSFPYAYNKAKQAIEKANKLLNSIK